jgi:AcrR family transcriptional regulator
MADLTGDTSPGLRERKRRDTRDQILARAIASFRELGIRGAHLGEIARASGVSQATLYNYFPNKAALAEAWVRGEIDQALQATSGEFEAGGLRRAIRAFCRELARLASGNEDTVVRLEAWRECGRARLQSITGDDPLVRALMRWQESERVRRDIDAEAIAVVLLESVEGGLIDGLRRGLDAQAFAATLQARLDLILDGARKRNERVAAPVASWVTRPVQSR